MSGIDTQRLTELGTGLAVALGCWLFGFAARRFMRPLLQRLAHRTATDIDDLLLESLRPYVPFWFLLLGLVIGARAAGIRPGAMPWVDRGVTVLLILSISVAVAAFAARWIARGGGGDEAGRRTTTLTEGMVRFAIISIGAMVALNTVGVSITPMLTALGVGSLAVALALQPTLSNLFAGMQISLNRQVRVGDFVEMENGQNGEIVDITWRTTQIREPSNNTIVVPNAKLVDAIVRNFNIPDAQMGLLVPVGVAYDSDLEQVERVTLEVAGEILRSDPAGVPDFQPLLRFSAFGDSAIQMNVILRARSRADGFALSHAFIKRLHARFRSEGIEIPFPQRVLHVRGGGEVVTGPE